jgi:hypothetical protein
MKPTFSLEQMDYIMKNAKDMTVKELSDELGLPKYTIAAMGYRHGFTFKKANRRVKESPTFTRGPYHKVPAHLLPDPPPPKIVRPAPVYDNSGYLKTLQTYGV